MKTIVRGRNVSLAILNQMNENDQNIIESITAPYVPANFFNFSGIFKWVGEFKINISNNP